MKERFPEGMEGEQGRPQNGGELLRSYRKAFWRGKMLEHIDDLQETDRIISESGTERTILQRSGDNIRVRTNKEGREYEENLSLEKLKKNPDFIARIEKFLRN